MSSLFIQKKSVNIDKPIVIDNGSSFIKAGFSEDIKPKVTFINVLAYQQGIYNEQLNNSNLSPYYIGEQVFSKINIGKLIYPVKKGKIVHWDAMEKIWHHLFYNKLRVNPLYHPILLSENIFGDKKMKKRIAEIFFETFCVPALYFEFSAKLILYGSGKFTGLVVDIGAEKTEIVPIYEGFIINNGIITSDLTGKQIDNYLQRLLSIKNSIFKSEKRLLDMRKIKETLTYVSLFPEKESKIYEKQNQYFLRYYTLPDGSKVEIGKERYLAPELLFNPNLSGLNDLPLHVSIVNSIRSCNIDIRSELYENIILSGGSSLFPGIRERLLREIREQVSTNIRVNISKFPDRDILPWIGGSVFSSINTFPNFWISRKDYKREGLDFLI